MPKPVRIRFAPSPTGFLQAGNVRTALFSWLAARHDRGQFILRIEDTDKAREVGGSEKHVLESLGWLGLDWDEGPDKGGPHGPYRQSQRLDIYKQWGQKLIDADRAYADPYTKEQLEAFRQKAVDQKKAFLFREHRPNPPAGGPAKWDGTQPLRFKSEPRAYTWQDRVMGQLSAGPEAVDDFIIIKSDGFPTYNFAHIIDDHLMKISHVTRSQEFLPSVPKFLNLSEALGIEPPEMVTLPYVMNPGGNRKLSKREGAKDLLDYKKQGYLPEAIINFLATLGWNDGSQQEIFSIQELIARFSLDRIQKSGARFDEQRLLWMNGHYIRAMSLESLAKSAEGYWPEDAKDTDESYKKAVLELVQERLKYLAELPELSEFFFKEPTADQITELYANPSDKQLKNIDPGKIADLLRATIEALRGSSFTRDDIADRLNQLLKQLQTKPGILFAAIRIAVTGAKSSPELFGTIATLGKEKASKRLLRALAALDK